MTRIRTRRRPTAAVLTAALVVEINMNELTTRELETVRLITSGFSNREIAQAMGISEHTAKFHVANCARKMGVNRRAEIVAMAIRGGIA
jgi:DNA-binding CsgD family transcriptional regulator